MAFPPLPQKCEPKYFPYVVFPRHSVVAKRKVTDLPIPRDPEHSMEVGTSFLVPINMSSHVALKE